MAISVASRSRGASSRPTIRPISRSISWTISSWMSAETFFFLRPGARVSRLGSSGADRFVDGNEPVAQRAELLVGIHLTLELVESASCAKLHGPRLACHLRSEGVVRAVARMISSVARAAGLTAGAESFREGALAQVAEPGDLAKDTVALGFEGVQSVEHGASNPIAPILSEHQRPPQLDHNSPHRTQPPRETDASAAAKPRSHTDCFFEDGAGKGTGVAAARPSIRCVRHGRSPDGQERATRCCACGPGRCGGCPSAATAQPAGRRHRLRTGGQSHRPPAGSRVPSLR